VKTAPIPALIADMKLFADLFFNHFFHDCNPRAFKVKILMVTRALSFRLPPKISFSLILASF
jgi:hypothetical protein